MKKQCSFILAMVAMVAGLIFSASAMAVDVAPYTEKTIDNVGGHNKTFFEPKGGKVFLTTTQTVFNPVDEDTEGKNLISSDTALLFSGIVDATGDKRPCDVGIVKNGTVSYKGFPNSGLIKKVPVVEHLWTRTPDLKSAGTIDPLDPWAIMEGNDLRTLCYGIVMWPNGSVTPLKSLGLGKLKQGPHPELSSK